MIFELIRGDEKQRSAEWMIFVQSSDGRICVLIRSSLICVKIANPTRQHSNTKIAMSPQMMFSVAGPHSVDAFCRFSRLETRSNDVKTTILFFLNFWFPDIQFQRG